MTSLYSVSLTGMSFGIAVLSVATFHFLQIDFFKRMNMPFCDPSVRSPVAENAEDGAVLDDLLLVDD